MTSGQGDPFCRHRWPAPRPAPDFGPCQCVRMSGHVDAHRCCCGAEDTGAVTLAERLDAAEDGQQFGAALDDLFRALEKAIDDE